MTMISHGVDSTALAYVCLVDHQQTVKTCELYHIYLVYQFPFDNRDMIAADYPDGEKEHVRQLHKKYFRSMGAPFPRMTSVTARGCLAFVCIFIIVAIMYAFR